MEMWCLDDMEGGTAGIELGHLRERACFNSRKWCGGSSQRIRIVAKGNGAIADWIIVVVLVALVLD